MNIAPSTDPKPMPARGDSSAAFAISAKDGETIPFADLLGTSPEHLPDGAPAPANADAKAQPRKQAEDGTDPALAILLPFMLAQVSQAVPSPPQLRDGSAVEMGGENPGEVMQAARVLPGIVETMARSGVTSLPACEAPDEAAPANAFAPNAASPDVVAAKAFSKMPASVAGMPAQSASDASVAVQSASSASRTAESASDVAGASAVSSAVAKVASPVTPASDTQPVHGGLPVIGVAAEISPATGQAVQNPVSSAVVSEPENGISQRQSQDVSGTPSAGEAGGTTAAMQRLTMKDQSSERQTRTAANVAVIPSAPGKQRVAGIPEKSSQTRVSESAQTTPTIAGMTFEPQAGRGQVSEALEAGEPTAASEITRQTFDLIERIRVTGRENAEVRMILNDGLEVTVSLRLERGEWKPVFKTESEALCRALELKWNRAVAQPAPQSVKFGTPVFESHAAHSDLGGNSQQQSESGGRERSFHRRGEDAGFENVVPFPVAAKPTRAAHVSRFSEAAVMQVYA